MGEGRGTYAVSGYFYDYQDLQFLIYGLGSVRVENVGEAAGQGFEAEVAVALSPNLDLTFNAAWAETEVDDVGLDVCSEADGSTCNGNRLAASPKFTAAGALVGHVPVGAAELFAAMEVVHSGSIHSEVSNNPQFEVDSWTLVNFRAGADFRQRWRVSAFVENALEEELVFRGWVNFTPVGIDPVRPRTYGIDLRLEF